MNRDSTMIKKLLLALLIVLPLAARAQSEVSPNKYGAIIVEANSGKVLFAEGENRVLHPASLTKLMTLYLTFAALRAGQLSENTPLLVSEFAAAASPTKLGLRAGQTIAVKDAVLGLVTRSANDAARVLAERIGGDEPHFAQMMTQQARRLGMDKTRFYNASGLPDGRQVSSPRDMAILARAIITHFPEYYEYFNKRSFVFRGQVYANHNHLMDRYPGMDGLKTGYVAASGFNLVSSAVQGDIRLIGVVFGGRSAALRDSRMEKLLNNAFYTARNEQEHSISRYAATPLAPPVREDLDEPDSGKVETADATSQQVDVVDDNPAAEAETAKIAPVVQAASLQPPAKRTKAERNDIVRANWGVQVGAYKSKREAQKTLSHLRRNYRDLKNTTQVVSAIKTKGGLRLYRARLIGLTEARASNACTALAARGRSCVTVSPAG